MKNDKGPCKAKDCGHSELKHLNKGKGACMVLGCPCGAYKN